MQAQVWIPLPVNEGDTYRSLRWKILKLENKGGGNIQVCLVRFDVCIPKVFDYTLPVCICLSFTQFLFTYFYRKKALYPILHVYYWMDCLQDLRHGECRICISWTILWEVVTNFPSHEKFPKKKIQPIVYMVVNACHGFLFWNTLYLTQAILLDWVSKDEVPGLCWPAVGFVHGINNIYHSV